MSDGWLGGLRLPQSWRQASQGLRSWRSGAYSGLGQTQGGGYSGLGQPAEMQFSGLGADPNVNYSSGFATATPGVQGVEFWGLSPEDRAAAQEAWAAEQAGVTPAAADRPAHEQTRTSEGRGTPNAPTKVGTGGSGWEVQDQWNPSYDQASAKTGVPANFIKAVQGIETGRADYTGQKNCNVPGISETMGCLALDSGLFQKSVEDLGLDFNRVVNDPDYAIYAMGQHMSWLASQDSGNYGGTPGVSVLDYGDWKAVSQVYFTGSLAKDTDAGALGGRSFENSYWPDVETYLNQLGGMGGYGGPNDPGTTDPYASGAIMAPAPAGSMTTTSDIWGGTDAAITQGIGSNEGAVYNNDAHIYDYCQEYGVTGHCGVDYALPYGTKTAAPVSGTITHVGGPYYEEATGGPGEIRITADNGDVIIFGHMSAAYVKEGDRVSVGDTLGATGQSDSRPESAHLHLEVRVLQPDGTYRIADPDDYFAQQAAVNSGGGGGGGGGGYR